MNIKEYLEKNGISLYRAEKETGIPHNTFWCIYAGKTSLSRCSGLTLLKLAKWMGVTIEELLLPEIEAEKVALKDNA